MQNCKNCGKSLDGKPSWPMFCTSKGKDNCKDKYHNSVDESRLRKQPCDISKKES